MTRLTYFFQSNCDVSFVVFFLFCVFVGSRAAVAFFFFSAALFDTRRPPQFFFRSSPSLCFLSFLFLFFLNLEPHTRTFHCRTCNESNNNFNSLQCSFELAMQGNLMK